MQSYLSPASFVPAASSSDTSTPHLKAAFESLKAYHDYYIKLPDGRLMSYRKTQTGDLVRLGFNVFGAHFEGRYIPYAHVERLSDADRAWLIEAFDRRIEEDRAIRASVDAPVTATAKPTPIPVAKPMLQQTLR